ncbi:MAG TPA: hypothetical protein DCR13_04510, partial [Gammaproteobacteria bacterium]|nr:hypothetical protein [Gammaproteobacteria bacterium]
MSCSCKISTSFPTALPKQHGYFRVSGLVFSIIFLLLFTCALITIWVLPTQKDNIAHWLSEKVGHAVTIGEVDMVWQDNRPQLLLTSMKVLQDEGVGALSFTSLRLGLNIWASLVDQQLHIGQIALEGVSVTLVRNQQGMSFFQVTDTVGPSLVPIDVISALTELKKISLSAVTVNYFDRVSTVLTGRYIINDAVLTHEKGAWDSKTSVLLPSKLGKAIAIEASWQLDANSFDETTWQIEVVADSLLLDYFRSYLVLRNIQLQQGVMGAKIYSEGRGKNIVSIETTFQGEGWSLSHLPRSDFIHVDRIAGQFQWQQQAEQWQLKSQQLDVIIQGQQADITELEIRQYGQQIALSAKSFDLAVISMLKPLVASWLEQPEQYSISGLMQDLEISYDTASGVQQAKGQANDIVIRDDEHGVLMSNLSGEWSYSPSYSLFQFDSQDITIRPDENWQQAMHFEQVTGELIIQSVSDQVISIQTNELVISNPDMMVAVDGYSDYDLAVENILHNEIAIKVNYFDVTKWQDYIPSHFLDPDF